MKLLWWNTLRLSAESDDKKVNAIEATQGEADFSFFGEVMESGGGDAMNYRKSTGHQLGYTAYAGNNVQQLQVYEPADQDMGASGFKGGSKFSGISDRKCAYKLCKGNAGDIHVYIFHAPASSSGGAKAVAFLAVALNALHGGQPWVLIGDLNVEPEDLKKQCRALPIKIEDLIVEPPEATFVGKVGSTSAPKKYDYALSNINRNALNLRVLKRSPRLGQSDHLPIVLEIG